MLKIKNMLYLSLLLMVAMVLVGSNQATAAPVIDSSSGSQLFQSTAPIVTAAAAVVVGDIKNTKYEKFIIKKFRHVGTWVQEVQSKNGWVNNDVIKIPKRGGTAPRVLINNNVYPINSNRRDDDHVVVALNKYDTENRDVTDDELYAIAYDKEGDINLELKEELEETTIDHALYSISPSSNSADTPVIETTGDDDGTGRRRLTKKDLITLKTKLDTLKVPKVGRILVLGNEHVGDLLIEDSVFEKGYQNRKDGLIHTKYYGFKVYEENYTPKYNSATNTKLAFDSVVAGKNSSIVFHKKSTCKAVGSTKRYALPSHLNPTDRQATLGYRQYFGCYAIQDQGQAAIIDGNV
jgi:hypothetical protein